jgi:hypothetical protein
MKLPINGSLLANSLLVAAGAVFGATTYWTVEKIEIFPHINDSHQIADDSSDPRRDKNSNRGKSKRADSDYRSGEDGARALGSVSVEAQLRNASSETDPKLRSELLSRAGAEGARRDVEEALKMGNSLQRVQDKIDYFRGLFGVWSEVDPESSLTYAKQNFTAGLLQSEVISLVVNKWGAVNAQDARLWTEQNLSGPIRDQAMTDLMIGWTRRNPDLASNWLSQSNITTSSMLSAVGATWAEQDPKAAAYWAGGLSTGAGRRTASLAVANEWARQDPETAANFFEEKVQESDGIDLATVIVDVWGTSDPAAAAVWVSDLPTGPVRDQAAGTLATVWATRDIDAAVAWSENIDDPGMRSQVVAHLATTWGALEPDRAVEWLAGLSPELAQVGVIGAFNSWAAVDPYGMWDWVENSEPSIVSDQARRSLADVRSQDDILDSIDLALGISSEEERNDAVARYFKRWRKSDDASAQEWLSEYWGVIPPDLQERLNKEQLSKIAP